VARTALRSDLERFSECVDVVETDVALTALDAADVVAVKSSSFGESLLGVTLFFA
jgi:hypothetical protein